MGEIVIHQGNLDAKGKRFALVAARYNEFVTNRLLSGAEDCMLRHGAAPEDIEVFRVPGAFEIPLVARQVARTGRFAALVCLGAVTQSDSLPGPSRSTLRCPALTVGPPPSCHPSDQAWRHHSTPTPYPARVSGGLGGQLAPAPAGERRF